VPGGRSYTHLTYRSASGQALIEQYMIDGAGHMYPGGCSCSLYGDPSGPNATGITWDFFLAHPRR
jgi:poly(3-hydroxybutyrate) depolymerase